MISVSAHLRGSESTCCRLQCLAPPTPGRPLLLYLSVSDVALGCMLAQLDDSGKDRAIYYLSKRMLDYETRYVMIERYCLALVWATRRLRHYMTEYSVHLISRLDPLRYLFDRPALKSIRGSIVGRSLASLPVSDARAIDDDFPDEDVAAVTSLSGWRISVRLAFSDRHPATNNIVEYEACILGLETASSLGLDRWRAQNQFADALATLASMIDIPVDATVRPLLIESRSAPAILGVYPEAATAKDKRALRQLATRFVICGETLYRRSPDGMLLLCLDRTLPIGDEREVSRVSDTRRSHSRAALRVARTDFTMAIFIWGIDIIGKISPKSSSGHEFILVAIDYFTKWVEAASYARLTSSGVASFIRSHIICRYGVPHELISDRGPQTNGAVEAANKNIKRILRRMVETSRDWSEKLPFALWAYRTSFRTSTGATPYSLVYGMEAMLPVEIEMGSLRVALEQQIPEADWAQARFDQLNLLDERRLRAADHVRAYQRKMARAFKKRVKPRPLQIGDLVLKVIRGLIRDPRGKFRPNWSGPYFIRELTPEGAAWLMDLDGNRFSEPTNVDQLKRYYV
ncbi:Pol polyprotein [Vitis vinifera]|uniref:Pol polyprotein n=1 Tax=Vitis vinifera TaxID=29760 RepID=A0A438GYP4_VITVI|nr:Pol polyprotein [Vitis vinifera]